MSHPVTGAEIRQSFIDFFVGKGHTVVPSSSLVPGGDQTLLFTNAGMVQFKDVFLGTDNRTYSRAVNSQKCMRVAGKHNDLDDVGRDDTHHTFFEMLGNWSFGDYYKREAITWAWELLTEVWGLDKTSLWVTCFKDEKGEIPTDDEAASVWAEQPGINPEHIVFFGRKENFWEMADVGPCGPDSEIHIDMGEGFCNKKHEPGHVCRVNGDCNRLIELWNLVFIQYNRIDATTLEPLPATHVDTGMGFERITSVIQHVNSNYRTDLFTPLTGKVRELTGYSTAQMDADFTPFRVIADHARAAAFLIADGVVPGNTGRNYICRMIIRRASRFGGKIGLTKPFLAEIAQAVIENYGKAYPELQRNKKSILDNITREETRFQRTIETGMQRLDELMQTVRNSGSNILPGKELFDLYATHGLPLELSRDVAREHGLDVDESGFKLAMQEHRDASGAGKSFGALGGEEVELFREVVEELIEDGLLNRSGVLYDPYTRLSVKTPVLALFSHGERVTCALENNTVDVIFPETCFYVEAGGQIADQGTYRAGGAVIKITGVRRPAAGAIVHRGVILQGKVCDGDEGVLEVDVDRRNDIMRNHTATHLLHAALHKVLGDHARQAGSLVTPDKLRFDFTHPEAMTHSEIELVQNIVNEEIAHGYRLNFIEKKLDQAMEEGAMALFGEKYGDVVRTVTIADGNEKISYELCGGTHVTATNDIGMFLIVSESSAAAGIRRIEAVTGRGAYDLVRKRLSILQRTSQILETNVEEVPEKVIGLLEESETRRKQFQKLQQEQAIRDFQGRLNDVPLVKNVPVLAVSIQHANADILRNMADLFRNRYKSGVVVLGTVIEEKPVLIAAVTDDLVQKGISANDIVKVIAPAIGGSGGGRPALAQAGGKDPSRLDDALQQVAALVSAKL
ncbi:MAG TPA: alanine--tRNA ligase [Anaerolineaceae bacterium]|nr:alanine--tRNA ligase [Anaerolineaceae bacterium]